MLLVSPNFYPKVGGVESHLIELIRHLSDVEFAVLTNWRPGTKKAAALFPNIKFYYVWPADLPLRKWFSRSRITLKAYRVLGAILEILRSLNRRCWLRRIDADVVHFHSLNMEQADRVARRLRLTRLISLWYPWTVAHAKSRSKILLTDHTVFTAPREVVPDETKLALLRTFDSIVSVDKKSSEVIKTFQEARGGRLWYIPNSVDSDVFLAKGNLHDQFHVGFAGRIGKPGQDLLKSVVRELRSEVEWDFAIGGEDSDVIRSGLDPTGSPSAVAANLNYDQMPTFYSSLDVLLNPFPGEGIGRTTIEAMSCGIPVVVVGTGDKYPVINGKTGYMVSPDPKLIASSILHLKQSPETRLRFAREARSIVEKEFSNRALLPKLRDAYVELCKSVDP